MSGHQHATVNDTVYFYFAANDTSGSAGDGASPLFDVREAGAAVDAIPLLSGTPDLLTHANYPAGCYEVAVDATTGNGFAANDTFAVFCTLAIDAQNPAGFVGSCTLTPLATAAALATAQADLTALKKGIIFGAAEAGSLSKTNCTTDLTGYASADLVGAVIVFDSGDADGCRAAITSYNTTNGEVTFAAGINTTVAVGDTFKII